MVFSSILFLFRFLPLVLLLYFAVPARFRNGILFAASLLFYGWGEPVYILLLIGSTVTDFVLGQLVEHFRLTGQRGAARAGLMASLFINLGLLGFFKYAGFVMGTANTLLSASLPVPQLALPVGISFYTFQTLSYTIDVYRGRVSAQKNLIDFGAFVSMFPQLIAGPIVRYSEVCEELKSRRETLSGFSEGVLRFSVGLAKKVLIANQMGLIWEEVGGIAAADRSILLVWFGLFAFGMQIYFDFSGYSDMAIGLGRMFGFHFPENFRYPYESRSVTEFWRRWHISLGSWFKEYVYFPLGGSRGGRAKQIRNILLVWLLTGLWHGAGWNFLFWGLYFGVLLLLEKLLLGAVLERLPAFFRWLYAILAVFLGWVLFAFDHFGEGLAYLGQLFGFGSIPLLNGRGVYLLVTNLVLSVIALAGATSLPAALAGRWVQEGSSRILQPLFVTVLLLLSTAFLVNAGYNPFLYFRF